MMVFCEICKSGDMGGSGGFGQKVIKKFENGHEMPKNHCFEAPEGQKSPFSAQNRSPEAHFQHNATMQGLTPSLNRGSDTHV
jgi:hypothetical protein